VEHSSAIGCDNNTPPAPGGAGFSVCGRPGGAGGIAGIGSNNGAKGDDAAYMWNSGGFGGLGGGHNPPGGGAGDGQVGGDGNPSGNGPSGAGGPDVGVFAGRLYMPASGQNAGEGGHGYGGGGGGGGGGGTSSCRSTGS